jgi:dipeptidase D
MQEIISDNKANSKLEPNLTIRNWKVVTRKCDLGVQEGLLRSVYTAHNSVYRMSTDMEDLVETSNMYWLSWKMAKFQFKFNAFFETSKFDLANALRSAYELFGCRSYFWRKTILVGHQM